MHACVCLFPSLCLRMWSFGSCKRRSSRSATMDRFPAIFLSSLNLMTANTASHGFELNLLRATWSQVSFPFTTASACHHLGLTSSSLSACLSLRCLYIRVSHPFPTVVLFLLLWTVDFSTRKLWTTMHHLFHFRWDSRHFSWCLRQQRLCNHPELWWRSDWGHSCPSFGSRQRLLLDHRRELPSELLWDILRGFVSNEKANPRSSCYQTHRLGEKHSKNHLHI